MNLSNDDKNKIIEEINHQETQKIRKDREKQTIRDYESLSIIGRGAFGEVHVCREKKTGNIVAIKKMKKESQLLHCDETTIQCNKEVGRKATSNSYMWVMRSGETEKNKGVIFKYAPSRSAETAKEFLSGYQGTLVTDGYASYNHIESIKHAECWAHARRYFYESIPLLDNKKMDTTTEGYVGVTYCDRLFKIEQEIALLSEDEKTKVRQ